MKTQKRKFIIFQIGIVFFSLFTILFFHSEEKGWWIFKYTVYSNAFFGALAFMIATFYMFLLTIWFNDSDSSFNWKTSIKSFLICGTISVIVSVFALYPLWDFAGFREVGWIFKSKVARDPLFDFFEYTGAIAGPVEEIGKLLAVLLIPSVMKSIKDKKTGVFYVTLCAFGFAMIENIKYFIADEEVIILRANPAHAVFSAIWGRALGLFFSKEISKKEFMKYLLLGMGLHAAWNFLVSIGSIIFYLIFILTSWKGLIFIRKELKSSG